MRRVERLSPPHAANITAAATPTVSALFAINGALWFTCTAFWTRPSWRALVLSPLPPPSALWLIADVGLRARLAEESAIPGKKGHLACASPAPATAACAEHVVLHKVNNGVAAWEVQSSYHQQFLAALDFLFQSITS